MSVTSKRGLQGTLLGGSGNPPHAARLCLCFPSLGDKAKLIS